MMSHIRGVQSVLCKSLKTTIIFHSKEKIKKISNLLICDASESIFNFLDVHFLNALWFQNSSESLINRKFSAFIKKFTNIFPINFQSLTSTTWKHSLFSVYPSHLLSIYQRKEESSGYWFSHLIKFS